MEGYMPGEEDEVFEDELKRDIDEDEIRRHDELDFPELYQEDESVQEGAGLCKPMEQFQHTDC